MSRPGLPRPLLAASEVDIAGTGYAADDELTPAPRLRAGDGLQQLNESARFLATRVRDLGRVSIGDLAHTLSERHGLPLETARADVAGFVRSAQVAGLISLHSTPSRTFTNYHKEYAFQLAVAPIVGTVAGLGTRRRFVVPSARDLVLTVGRSQALLGLALLVPILLFFMALLGIPLWEADAAQRHFVGALTASFLVATVCLGVVHELAHLMTARLLGVPVSALYVDGLRVGLHRESGRPGQSAAITLAGPLLAAALGAVALVGVATVDAGDLSRPVQSALVLGVAIPTLYHAICLVPPAADGRALFRALASWRAGRGGATP